MNKSMAAFVVITGILIYYFAWSEDFNPEAIRGKRVLVTGASQNIGKQIAIEFAKLGANVVVTARNEEKLSKVVEACTNEGASSAQYVVADMSDLNQTKSTISKSVAILGGIDYLVLNHIAMSNPALWDDSQANLDFAVKATYVNYMSYIHLSTYAAPFLQKANGHLTIVSSLAGYFSMPIDPAYAASKAAINQFYSNLRMSNSLQNSSRYSVTVCLLGYIATDNKEWDSRVALKGYPMVDTALEVIKGATRRKPYIFVPSWSIVTTIFRAFPTDLFDSIIVKLSRSNS